MPIKNYTTEVPAYRSIQEIYAALRAHGATDVQYAYEVGTIRVAALRFRLIIDGQQVPFSLPVAWQRFQRVLEQQGVSRWRDDAYVYRVAWRNIRDWVMAQLALYDTLIVDLPQVFLPFATDRQGRTLYEQVQAGRFFLEDGSHHA